MSPTAYPVLTCVLVLVLFPVCAGCLSTNVEDTSYSNHAVMMNISHTGDPADVYVQVTVYRVANLSQEMYTIVDSPARLVNGENTIALPVQLEPGSYKLYVYVISNGDRKTAVIRDIIV
jgi:hypothetical protein